MAEITIPRIDKGFNLNFTVKDADDVAYNLTGYTITLKVWKAGSSDTLLLSGTCTILVAAAGTCYYTLTATDFIIAGVYKAELELTKAGVIESTKSFTIEVSESG